jgi:very-short-patch-repair endonuclease
MIGLTTLLQNALNFANTVSDSERTTIDDDIFKVRLEIQKEKRTDNTSGNKNIFYKHWRDGKREYHIKSILENLTQKKWISIRPKWLKNPYTKRNLEIDCYCEQLNIAVEIDGEQHHHYVSWFHKTFQNYLKQKENDLIKAKLLRERGVRLIRIPYDVPYNKLEEYIITQLFIS